MGYFVCLIIGALVGILAVCMCIVSSEADRRKYGHGIKHPAPPKPPPPKKEED